MKIFVLPVALAALLLAACGEKPAPAPTATDKPKAETPAATNKPKRVRTGAPLAQPMPQGVTLDFPYHFRSDRVQQTKNGDSRRLVMVEALGGDMRSIGRDLRASMKAAGFRPVVPAKNVPLEADGSQRLVFVKKGWKGRVTTVTTPVGSRKMRNKDAVATITFFWDDPDAVPGDAAAPAAAPAATSETPAAPPAGQ